MREGRRDELISERTYNQNKKKLNKWFNHAINKIE